MLLGLDIGSSSVKAALIDSRTGKCLATASAPEVEMPIVSLHPGWAEQAPEAWWQNVTDALAKLRQHLPKEFAAIEAVGIAYQMHGLVCLDENGAPLRPSIIWCDSRAVGIGEKAFGDLGQDWCLTHLLNSPGNFTASKLRWVKEVEPEIFSRIRHIMLPGDYIAYRLTGEICTTDTGLSEGIMWNFLEGKPADKLLNHYGIPPELLPPLKPVFSVQGILSDAASSATGLPAGIPVAYRSGDQPNNAFSLNVLHPGETAATAGTSGVVYSVTERNAHDPKSRVNTFLHVNHTHELQRNGVLLCLNGTGILNSWVRKLLGGLSYDRMNAMAATVPIGSGGLVIHPFGNGAERILGNRNPGALMSLIDFNRHDHTHVVRAAQEGIVFALAYGFDILRSMDIRTNVVRAGRTNMFLSPVFREAFVNTLQVPLELYETNGAVGAAVGAGVGAGIYSTFPEAFQGLELLHTEEPNPRIVPEYRSARQVWMSVMEHMDIGL